MKTLEPVLVVLGVPLEYGPMPATITRWPKGGRMRFQYLSPDQLEAMGADQTAIWEAEFIDGHYWLERRMTEFDDSGALQRFVSKPVVLDDTETPF